VEGVAKVCSPDNVELPGEAPPQLNAGASRWYALHVRSRHEKVVEKGLRGKGYAVFSPFYRTRRKRSAGLSKLMWLCF